MPRLRPSVKDEMSSLASWVDQAACREQDPRDWDTIRANQVTLVTETVERAKETCLSCPVMMDCLIHSVVFEKRDQVWGGMTDEERDEWGAREGLLDSVA